MVAEGGAWLMEADDKTLDSNLCNGGEECEDLTDEWREMDDHLSEALWWQEGAQNGNGRCSVILSLLARTVHKEPVHLSIGVVDTFP